jgi:ATP-dependent RNA helicase SUPV3L1/SUV3
LTGQDKKIDEEATHSSCTIELVNLEENYDVAIIDEI